MIACLGDDEQGEVQAIHEQVGDGAPHKGLGALLVTLDQDHLQAGRHHVAHQQAVVAPHDLDALAPRMIESAERLLQGL